MKDNKMHGVFCIETIWQKIDDQTSMRAILEVLRYRFAGAPFVHRTIVTNDELAIVRMIGFLLTNKNFPSSI